MTHLLGIRVDPTDYAAATARIVDWAHAREGRYVCVANVHSLMEGQDSTDFSSILNGADMVVPDGMPLVWMLRSKGCDPARRVYGPALMRFLLAEAASAGLPLGYFGSTPDVLENLARKTAEQYQGLRIVYLEAPPFRPPTADEDERTCQRIRDSGARLLFVGLGCPKQERWMAAHRSQLDLPMVGVGAAFDFIAGTKRQAPRWMQEMGLEWLFRLAQEPLRLGKRYLVQNPRFLVLASIEVLRRRSPSC